jgi:hypothetical protein
MPLEVHAGTNIRSARFAVALTFCWAAGTEGEEDEE